MEGIEGVVSDSRPDESTGDPSATGPGDCWLLRPVDFLGWRRVILLRICRISSRIWIPSAGLGLVSLMNRSRCRPSEEAVNVAWQKGHSLSFAIEALPFSPSPAPSDSDWCSNILTADVVGLGDSDGKEPCDGPSPMAGSREFHSSWR